MRTTCTPIRKITFLFAILGALAFVAGPAAASSTLALRDGATLVNPEFEIHSSNDQGVHLTFELPALAMEQYDIEGVTYQTLDVPGGQLYGEDGTPSLPGFTRYVAIPARSGVELTILSVEQETLSGYRLLPMIATG